MEEPHFCTRVLVVQAELQKHMYCLIDNLDAEPLTDKGTARSDKAQFVKCFFSYLKASVDITKKQTVLKKEWYISESLG
ncbi:hypothetical protein DV515_00000419 [Chloebia gouldiae]|uniref:Uncharacterized protein n=1 Tax=Chloebia gouldiae TaxID=44316 RepID=A0A3L8T165_CHLGU|nr:hypothetical protein DV515_00000419 [Chloebia gouldiae]